MTTLVIPVILLALAAILIVVVNAIEERKDR